MRIQSTLILLAAFAATEASASSITALAPGTSFPSMIRLGEEAAIDPSIVAATPMPEGPGPSIVALADTPAGATPSIVALGDPAPGEATVEAAPDADGQPVMKPVVIRGGEVGGAASAPAQASTSGSQPTRLLNPNDKGTPAKRRALKKQAERLARNRAEQGSLQPDPGNATASPGT